MEIVEYGNSRIWKWSNKLRAKIEELETNSKIQNIRDLYRGSNDFKKGVPAQM